jgi:hypothetical protein
MYTSEAGSAECGLCIEENYISGSGECVACPEGAICVEGTTVASMVLEEGHYRFGPATASVHECLYAGNCKGWWTNPLNARSSTLRLSTNLDNPPQLTPRSPTTHRQIPTTGGAINASAQEQCVEGSVGPLCSLCQTGWYLDTNEEQCAICSGFSVNLTQVNIRKRVKGTYTFLRLHSTLPICHPHHCTALTRS